MNSAINRYVAQSLAAALVALTTAGCASDYGESRSEREFGNSVRHVVQAQKANPDRSENPDPNPVDHADGARMEPVLKAYRTDTGAPEKVERDILIDISE
jgi:hypothetical protein